MASIRDFAVTEYGLATATTLVCNMPVHQSGDLLIYFASKDGTPAINAVGGSWVGIQDGASAGMAYRSEYKYAASAAETLSLVTGTGENWTVVVVAVQDCASSSPIDTSAESGSDDSAMPFAGPTITTGTDNCLIFHAWFTDSGLSPTAYAPLVNIYGGDNGANSTGVAYSYKRTAGAVPAGSWFGRGDDDGRGICVAVKDASSEVSVPPYSDAAVSSGQVLRPLVGLGTMFSDTWPVALTITALGSDFPANSVYVYEVAPSYTDKTTDANDPGTADVTWPQHVGDMMYFGNTVPFATLSFITSTAGTGTPTVAWEYWNGAWTTAPGMSGIFSATGGARVGFTNETPPTDWAANDPGMGYSKYWVRCRITATGYTVVPVQSQIRLNGYVAAYIVATAAADAGTNPYTDACQNAGAQSAANISGCQITFGAAVDMSSGIIMGTFGGVLPSDFAKDIAKPSKAPGGIQISFFDTNNNCLSYKLGAIGAKTLDVDGRNVFAIDWNGSATPWATCGSISKSAVTYMYLTTLGYFAAAAHRWSMLVRVALTAIAGGTSGLPLDLDKISYAANRSMGFFPLLRQSGAAVTIYTPLQFGGSDKVCIFCNLNTFQFPTLYDGVSYFDWNAAANVAGIKFKPVANDVLKFTNCVFTSASAYRWEWDSGAASSGWTGDFSGTSVVNATVTLQAVFTFNLMAFINCPTFTQNGATITNSKFTNTKVSSASPAAAALISSTTFTSGGSGHAIEIGGTAANMTLNGVTFSGYSGTSTNAPIFVNIASGSMTISITGGGSVPTIRTAGATVTVQNAVTVKVTVKDVNTGAVIENARVLLEAAAGGDLTAGTDILSALTNSSGVVQDTAFNFTNTQPVTGKVRKSTASPLYKTSPISGSITSAGLDVTIFMIPDE
jgi:hypothetical protein